MHLPVALVQLDARDDVAANIEAAVALADAAAAAGARLVALPEYLQFRGTDDGFRASARPIPDRTPTRSPTSRVATAPGSSSAARRRRATTRPGRTTPRR